jgi:hypothetical protein
MENVIKRPVGQPRKYPKNANLVSLSFKVPSEIKEHLKTIVQTELVKYRMKYNQTELFNNSKND